MPEDLEKISFLRQFSFSAIRFRPIIFRYYDKEGDFRPVRFVSYIWKFIDGLILASLRKELRHEKQRVTGFRDGEEYDMPDYL